ncbi:MAG: heparinase II/III family protein [Opitutaceae bacterium]|nr:heparinase II/III family protein [Opitutaceae bacterium]
MFRYFALLTLLAVAALGAGERRHPSLLLTPESVQGIRSALGSSPLFDSAVAEIKAKMEKAMNKSIDVPEPKDAAGYTHERHKQNYLEMYWAGLLYQFTGESRYAEFVKAMLGRYADLYPKLGRHPAAKSSSPGRLFHQSLNECVWLVHVSQAYDCIHDSLTDGERARFEKQVLREVTNYLTIERSHEIDRIHNHGTWACAAVGLAGYAMGDQDLVEKALRGSRKDGKGGFLAQMDQLYSPDGYYAEGPYYARYVINPFFVFAEAIENNQPELEIYKRRDGVLGKAVEALLQQSYVNGEFIPFNDSLKEKTIHSPEVVLAVNLAYHRYGANESLLSVARKQGSVSLLGAGLAVARDLARNAASSTHAKRSIEFRDGAAGDKGGVGILRSPSAGGESLLLMKYSSFGMEHGHYDKLHILYYDQGREIVPDYGAARFVNVEQKFGGRYLPENKSFAMQTVAHNTLVVDRKTQYNGEYKKAEHLHSERHYFSAEDKHFQFVSARDITAVPGVAMQRTSALVVDPRLEFPIVIDVFRALSDTEHDYDLPFYFQGQFLSTNADLTVHATSRAPLGESHGYQHLWLEAEGKPHSLTQFTFLNGSRYYSLCSTSLTPQTLNLVRIGANDPNFNLRSEAGMLLRTRASHQVYATVIEPHGYRDAIRETNLGAFPSVQQVEILAATDEGTVVRVTGHGALTLILCLSNRASGWEGPHRIETRSEVFEWSGPACLIRR